MNVHDAYELVSETIRTGGMSTHDMLMLQDEITTALLERVF